MAFFRLLTLGFGAGAFGACILALANLLLTSLRAQEMLGLPPPDPENTLQTLYRIVTWGGIWGFLFVLPVMNRLWWLKGLIIGALATAAIVFYFHPAVLTPPIRVVYVLVLNLIWGLAAGLWWAAVSGTRRNERRFGTFMR